MLLRPDALVGLRHHPLDVVQLADQHRLRVDARHGRQALLDRAGHGVGEHFFLAGCDRLQHLRRIGQRRERFGVQVVGHFIGIHPDQRRLHRVHRQIQDHDQDRAQQQRPWHIPRRIFCLSCRHNHRLKANKSVHQQ